MFDVKYLQTLNTVHAGHIRKYGRLSAPLNQSRAHARMKVKSNGQDREDLA